MQMKSIRIIFKIEFMCWEIIDTTEFLDLNIL